MNAELEIAELRELVESLATRVEALESQLAAGSTVSRPARSKSVSVDLGAIPDWAVPYEPALLDAGETWIELHEPSARPQLQRLITQLVNEEGPVTETYVLRRIREAWGIKRAGQRIQQVFEQSLRQLAASRQLERRDGAVLHRVDGEVEDVRIATDDDQTKRSVDEIPLDEMELALVRVVRDAALIHADDATAKVSRLFGWTRRGTEIQNALDAALSRALKSELIRQGDAGLEWVGEVVDAPPSVGSGVSEYS